MHADVRLSTKFLTTQNAHQVGLLTTLTGRMPVRRAPINVALVLDRSGSMGGMPLEAAKAAAIRFASFLGADDRLAVVTFDDTVRTVFGPAPAGDGTAAEAIARVLAGGSTNLSGGWLKGLQHARTGLVDGTNRVVLLTDGQANAGITDTGQLVAMSLAGAERRVTTTCIGFGEGFNEDLLEPMARQGGGNYWYVERDDQMAAIFEDEIEGLVALAAQNVEVEVALTHPKAAGVSFLQSLPVETTPAGTWRVRIGDLYATSPRTLGLLVHVEEVESLGTVPVAEVRIEADVVSEQGIEHRTTVMPVLANLDGTDHVEPLVEQSFLRFAAAKAREEAIRRADAGDLQGASACLHAVTAEMSVYGAVPEMAEEMQDLQTEAERLARAEYDAADRKYHAARAMASRESKADYARRISRRRP